MTALAHTAAAPHIRSAAFPQITLNLIATVLLAGAAATVAFDFFGQTISPLFKGVIDPYLGAKLAPVPLATAVLSKLTGAPGRELSALGLPYGVHILTGLIAYPLGWLLVARPIQRAVLPALPWVLTAVVYGVALWVFALYGMAHFVAGNPPFLNFTGITWVALVGHVLFAVVYAGVERSRIGAR